MFKRVQCFAISCLIIFRFCKTSRLPNSHTRSLVFSPYSLSSLSSFLRRTDCGTLKLAKPHSPISIIIIHQANPALPIIYRLSAKCTTPVHRCRLTRGLTAICLHISHHNDSSLLSMRAQSISKNVPIIFHYPLVQQCAEFIGFFTSACLHADWAAVVIFALASQFLASLSSSPLALL